MTCIAAVVDQGQICMGADSAASAGTALDIPAVEKIVRKRELLIGCSGSFRVLNLIRHQLEIPECDPRAKPERWLVNVFIERLRRCLNDAGSSKMENGFQSIDSNLLVGFRGSLYTIESDFLVLRFGHGFGSVGSGRDVALGSLHATKSVDITAKARVLTALKASAQFTTNCRPPFRVVYSK